MGLLDSLGDLVKQAAGGTLPAADVHSTFDKVAQAVPQGTLADGISHVFNSDQTPPFAQMLSQLFSQSTPEQKAGLLNQLTSALGPGGLSSVLAGAGGLGALGGLLQGGGPVTPAQASQVTPDQVQVLAQHAEKKNPSIVDVASGFYAQHPTLVKAIGAGALALLMSKISSARR